MPVRKTLAAVALATAAATASIVAAVPAAHAGAPVRHWACTYEDDYNDIVFYGGHNFTAGDVFCTANYEFAMQSDGNLVEYNANGDPIWNTSTYNHAGAYTSFQTDGNLVVYVSGNNPIWSSHSWGNTNATFAVQQDGNLVIYTTSRSVAWTSNTQWH